MDKPRTQSKSLPVASLLVLASALVVGFQNCGNRMSFSGEELEKSELPAECVSAGCEGTEPGAPLTFKPAVTTILIALGDQTNEELVVNGATAQLIAETVIRFTSPKAKPKILFVHDRNSGGEDPEDTAYAAKVLLGRYDLTQLDEPKSGLSDKDLKGFDVIWFNNPGSPMGSAVSRDALLRFEGGVVLQGDDMAWGKNFSMEELTGLRFIDNGTAVDCNSQEVLHDNNLGARYRVTMNPDNFPGVDASTVEFRYGNDIDNTAPIRRDLEIMATARGGPEFCTTRRPAIVRYLKPERPVPAEKSL